MKINIEGMACEHCSSRVEKALNNLSGVNATVHLASGTADIVLSANVSHDELRKAVEDAGYEVTSIE